MAAPATIAVSKLIVGWCGVGGHDDDEAGGGTSGGGIQLACTIFKLLSL